MTSSGRDQRVKTPFCVIRLGLAAGVAVMLLAVGLCDVRAQEVAEPPSTRAGTNRKAAARALFEEGLKLMEAQHWTAATDRFERARRLHASPRITYNLTTALLQTGRLVYASELLRELITTAAVERSVQEAAEQRLHALKDRLGTLTVVVEGDLSGATVEFNGRALDNALLDVPMPVDPGEHAVVARRDGKALVSRTMSVQEGENRKLHLAIPARLLHVPSASLAASAPPAHDPMTLQTSAQPKPEPPSSRLWLWVGAGVVATASVVVGALWLSKADGAVVEGTAGTTTLGAP